MISRYLSASLDSCLVERQFIATTSDEELRTQTFAGEKLKHKTLETKVSSLIDLLAFDDINLRLFYDHCAVTLQEIHGKYRQINLSFRESDFLSLLRMLICSAKEFAAAGWFFGNFEDLSSLVFAQTEGFQQFTLKVVGLEKAAYTSASQQAIDSKEASPKRAIEAYQIKRKASVGSAGELTISSLTMAKDRAFAKEILCICRLVWLTYIE